MTKITKSSKLKSKQSKLYICIALTVFTVLMVSSFYHIPVAYLKNILGATSKVYYVSPTGNDTNTGTESAPYKTFNKAQTSALEGDTVHLLAGTYPTTLKVTKNGLNIVGHNAVIDAAGLHSAIEISANNIVMEGFEAMHSNSHVVYISGKHITFKNSYVHDGIYEHKGSDGYPNSNGWGSGISIKHDIYGAGGSERMAEDVTIDNVRIERVYGEGLDMYGVSNVRVTNSTIVDAYSIGFYIDNSHDIVMERNLAYCTGDDRFRKSKSDATSVMAAYGMAIERIERWYPSVKWNAQLNNIRIVNNISYGCNGISMWGSEQPSGTANNGLRNAVIAHNSVFAVPSSRQAIWFAVLPDNSNVKVTNNLAGSNITPGAGITLAGNVAGVAFITSQYSNPVNIRPINGKDKGVASDVTSDFGGFARDGQPDAGAWEIGGTVTSTPTPTPTPTPTSTPIPTSTASPIPSPTPTNTPSPLPTTTPKPSATPTSKASATPKPSATTLLPSPTATPSLEILTKTVNNNPTIKTSWLGLNILRGMKYDSIFYATDKNLNDDLEMSISGLPQGITMSSCAKENWWNEQGFKCKVSGVSNKAGKYILQINVIDNNGGKDMKNVTFRVW